MRSIVAPHAGAWIETLQHRSISVVTSVAPHAGAWIETRQLVVQSIDRHVAPHAGAWIETSTPRRSRRSIVSPLTRGRGLKPFDWDETCVLRCVAPHAGAWIETCPTIERTIGARRPSRGGVD